MPESAQIKLLLTGGGSARREFKNTLAWPRINFVQYAAVQYSKTTENDIEYEFKLNSKPMEFVFSGH